MKLDEKFKQAIKIISNDINKIENNEKSILLLIKEIKLELETSYNSLRKEQLQSMLTICYNAIKAINEREKIEELEWERDQITSLNKHYITDNDIKRLEAINKTLKK